MIQIFRSNLKKIKTGYNVIFDLLFSFASLNFEKINKIKLVQILSSIFLSPLPR